MNSVKYQKILTTKLVKSMQKSFPDGSGIFLQATSQKNPKYFQKCQIDRSRLAWQLPRLESNRKLVGNH